MPSEKGIEKKKSSFKDIFALHTKYVEYLLEKTYFSNQYIRSLSQSGGEIEQEVRNLLREFLPKHFQVTHGYIVSARSKNQEPALSPQVDLIIVDTLVPHSIFSLDKQSGMEVVPVESVVGIFEIKRCLNRHSLLGNRNRVGAFKHLSNILTAVSIRKDDAATYLPGGISLAGTGGIDFTGGYKSNPIIGVIGCTHSKNFHQLGKEITFQAFLDIWKMSAKNLQGLDRKFPEVDIVVSLTGFMAGLTDPNTGKLHLATCRNLEYEYIYRVFHQGKNMSREKVVAISLGYILAYLQLVCGRQLRVENYFFNDKIV